MCVRIYLMSDFTRLYPSDDTYVFVLIVYWANLAEIQCKVQIELWDESVLDINATSADLGQKYLQLPVMLTKHSSVVIFRQQRGHCIEYYDIRKLPRF